MKNILVALIFVFALSVFNIEYSHAECFLFDGTYVGAAIVTSSDGKKVSRPLFIVVANQHITGFFASEDQKTHGPSGSSFNLGDLTASSVYTLSLTTDNNILISSKDGTINGKAKLGNIESGSSSFSGYYNRDIAGEFLPGDFLNIGSDGSAIVKVAAPENKEVVHAFGKINPSGEFVQVFPEKGRGPHVKITISGNTADIKIASGNGYFLTDLTRFSENSCNNNSTSSSSGGASSDRPAFVKTFKSVLNDLSLFSSTNFPAGNAELLMVQDTVRNIKLAFLSEPSDCSNQLEVNIKELYNEVMDLKTAACGEIISSSCTTGQLAVLSKMQEDQVTLSDSASLDQNNNEIADICETTVFDEKEILSLISTTFNNALKDIDVYSKKARREARKVSASGEEFFTSISKALRKAVSTLKAPASLCSLSIPEQILKLAGGIADAHNAVCAEGNENCPDESELSKAFEKLIIASDTITELGKKDKNKNEIRDVCE